MKLSQRNAKRARAKQHVKQSRTDKANALIESLHAAINLGSDGKQLKQPRSGKKLEDALTREMKNRGYKRSRNASGWQRMTWNERHAR
jgi:replication-associated recombination protein RarA